MNKKSKILLVDDDYDFVRSMKMILENNGYLVKVAYNRKEAMQKLKAEKPELLLLDIMMDRMNDGFILCQKLKNEPEFWDIPIIFISAITGKTGFDFSFQEYEKYFQAEDFIEKPVKVKELLDKIEKFLKFSK